jgi:hypothetical protein
MSDSVPAALRLLVFERAGGQCEYCLLPESAVLVSHEVDHIVARKHGGLSEESNLALCCTLCNKHKGSDLTSIDPESGEITPLYHPRRDHWNDHFRLEEAYLVPITAKGRVTVLLLQLNRSERIAEREILIAAGEIRLPGEVHE